MCFTDGFAETPVPYEAGLVRFINVFPAVQFSGIDNVQPWAKVWNSTDNMEKDYAVLNLAPRQSSIAANKNRVREQYSLLVSPDPGNPHAIEEVCQLVDRTFAIF